MRTFGAINLRESTTKNRTIERFSEQSFGPILAKVARLLWPAKTAAHIAAAAKCSERAAEFYLAGQRKWSGDAIAAIIAEILKRHSMRNLKVIRRE